MLELHLNSLYCRTLDRDDLEPAYTNFDQLVSPQDRLSTSAGGQAGGLAEVSQEGGLAEGGQAGGLAGQGCGLAEGGQAGGLAEGGRQAV